LRRNQSCRALL